MYCKKRAASKGGESEALKPLKQQPMLLFVLPLRSIPMLQAYHVRSTCSLCHQDCHWVFCCWLLVFVYGTCTLNQSSLFTPQVLNTFLTWIDPTRTAGVHVLRVKTAQEWFISTVHLAHRCWVQCLGGVSSHFRLPGASQDLTPNGGFLWEILGFREI